MLSSTLEIMEELEPKGKESQRWRQDRVMDLGTILPGLMS